MAIRAPTQGRGPPSERWTRSTQPPAQPTQSPRRRAGMEAGLTQRSPHPGAQRHGISASRKQPAHTQAAQRTHDDTRHEHTQERCRCKPASWPPRLAKSRRAMAQEEEKNRAKIQAVSRGTSDRGPLKVRMGGLDRQRIEPTPKKIPYSAVVHRAGEERSAMRPRSWPGRVHPLGHAPSSRITVRVTGGAEILWLGSTFIHKRHV